MTKAERASYLASLSALLKDQDASGATFRSLELATEYEREWKLLKEQIENEARKSTNDASRSQDRAEQPSG